MYMGKLMLMLVPPTYGLFGFWLEAFPEMPSGPPSGLFGLA